MHRLSIALFIAAASTTALTHVALAADLPVKAPPPAPTAPVYNWSGFYAGLNFGVGWGTSNNSSTASAPVVDFGTGTSAVVSGGTTTANSGIPGMNMNGPMGGGQIGYNWQFSPLIVFGLEADIQGADISGRVNGSPTASFAAQKLTISKSVKTANSAEALAASFTNPALTASGFDSLTADARWLGTVRGRLGYLVTPNFLVYATGGLAYGGVSANDSFTINNFDLSADAFALAFVQATGPGAGAAVAATTTSTTASAAATGVTTDITTASAASVTRAPNTAGAALTVTLTSPATATTAQVASVTPTNSTAANVITASAPGQTVTNFTHATAPLSAAIAANSQSFAHVSDTRVGGTIGGGFEWMMDHNWSFKAEALYYNLGSVTVTTPITSSVNLLTAANPFSGLPGAPDAHGAINKFAGPVTVSNTTTTRVKFEGLIIRVGLNYHFNLL